MKKLLGFCGESASGKDTIANSLLAQYPDIYYRKISYTTRKPRPHEVDGKDYHFITDDEFFNKIMKEEMIEATDFNGEVYGMSIDSLHDTKINVGMFDLDGLESVLMTKNIHLVPIYIKTDERIRLKRCLERDLNKTIDEIYDRYKLDRRLFDEIDSFPGMLTISNKEGDIELNARIIHLMAAGLFSK